MITRSHNVYYSSSNIQKFVLLYSQYYIEYLLFLGGETIFKDLCFSLDNLEEFQQSLSLGFTAIAQLTSFEEAQPVLLRKLYQAGLKLGGFFLNNIVKLLQGELVDLASVLSRALNISLSSSQVEVGGDLLTV